MILCVIPIRNNKSIGMKLLYCIILIHQCVLSFFLSFITILTFQTYIKHKFTYFHFFQDGSGYGSILCIVLVVLNYRKILLYKKKVNLLLRQRIYCWIDSYQTSCLRRIQFESKCVIFMPSFK